MKPIFGHVKPDDPEREITQKDQFNTDEVTLSETLVRESLQNSNDARRPEISKIQVRIALQESQPQHSEFWKSLFSELKPHLDACSIPLEGVNLQEPRILSIEDFGTTGLTGNAYGKDESNFQDFWRRVGRSHKGSDKSGSWGLGKIVFPASSKIRTFFGLTVRNNDPTATPLLMGQTVLRYHDVGSTRYDPLGLFAEQSSINEHPFRVPSSDKALIDRFIEACGLTRKSEPGLSIAIPFVRDEITDVKNLIPFVVRNYFFPILTGNLEVEIGGEQINEQSLDEFARKHGGPTLSDGHLIRFIRDMHQIRNGTPSLELPLSWTSQTIDAALGEESLKKLREAYAGRQMIHVRAPISLTPKAGGIQSGHFDLFLRQAEPGAKVTPLFVRGSITVPGESQFFPSKQAFAALVASDGVVSKFLRDAENPAHTRWNGQAERLQENWKSASIRLSQIRHSLRGLYESLAQAVDRIEEDALRDILAVKGSGVTQESKSKPIIRPRVIPKIEPRPKAFNLVKAGSGFLVKSSKNLAAQQLPLSLRIKAGYDVVRGDPFKKHSPFDFDFQKSGELVVSANGATWSAVAANEIQIEASELGFEVRVEGFDTRRDLKLRVGSGS